SPFTGELNRLEAHFIITPAWARGMPSGVAVGWNPVGVRPTPRTALPGCAPRPWAPVCNAFGVRSSPTLEVRGKPRGPDSCRPHGPAPSGVASDIRDSTREEG